MNKSNLITIINEVIKLDNVNKYEWIDDAIEDAIKITGIKIDEEEKTRAIRAVQLTLKDYDINKIDYFIEHGFTISEE